MPRYNPAVIEPKWQQSWQQHQTFATPRLPQGPKLYVLDMFPYPSGEGLHVGHPEGYTATDIVCRYRRMRGDCVMHPMGWDAFGLPAEQHAKKTGTHPRETTRRNIDRFRQQLERLGFGYDWSRELATTDAEYFRWTQFIFLLLYDTWYDPDEQRGRAIAELPVSADVRARGEAAVRRYQDEHRLAYQLEAPVNWCPALGTVLANEEVVGGLSERGGHPVVRIPLRQWMLRITAYADRLEKDLDALDWPENIKRLQRNWIGRSTGAEVDFYLGPARGADGKPALQDYRGWLDQRSRTGYPRKAGDDVLRIYTTRPDTLFGATYMVIAPEHPLVGRLTLPEHAAAVEAYCAEAARKSELDRTDLAKQKTGVFTGSYAINPVNDEPIPIWVADYVLISYGTGAIMAVPGHDTRDFEFAQELDLPIRCVVLPPDEWLDTLLDTGALRPEMLRPIAGDLRLIEMTVPSADDEEEPDDETARLDREIANEFGAVADWIIGEFDREDVGGFQFVMVYGHWPELFGQAYVGEGIAVNSGRFNGMSTAEFKRAITRALAAKGVGRPAVNYKLRDWLFSRQHFWGEPFPLLHELDARGEPTGAVRPLEPKDLPLDLPEQMAFDSSHDRPEPPLEKAPREWLYVTLDGKRYKRETNTMPQWAGSCWYYLRFLDPRNDRALVDPAVERAWMPVDLYVGGAEHAVLHLLYARFWHKVLYDRGYVSTPEPFQKLVNQGMILGEMEFTAFRRDDGTWVSLERVEEEREGSFVERPSGRALQAVKLDPAEVEKRGEAFVVKDEPGARVESRAYKMSKSRGNVVNPDQVVAEYGADALRLYEMFMGPLESVKPWSMEGVSGVRGFLDRVWRMMIDERAEEVRPAAAVQDVAPTEEQNRMLHRTIKAVTEDIDQMAFNTAIARMMEFTNFFLKQDPRPRCALETFVLLLSPFAPHLAEELWQTLGHERTLAHEPWPEYDEALIREETIEVPVQVNGRVRSRVRVPAEADQAALEAAARADERIAQLVEGKRVVRVIVVPGRLVNIVVK